MNDPTRHPRPPRPRQLSYLSDLAIQTGQTFPRPRTAGEASRQIDRLKKLLHTPAADRRRALREVAPDMAERRGGASAVDAEYELEGWGSTAAWSTFVEDEAEEEAREQEERERAASWR